MGLLDNLFSDDPQKQAQLAMALGLLSGSGHSNKNFGADLGSAGQQGLLTYGAARNQQSRLALEQQAQQMHQMQLAQMRAANDEQGRIQALGPQFMRPGQPQFQPNDQETPSGPGQPQMDWHGYAQGLTGIDPQKGLALQAQLAQMNARNLQKLGEGDKLVDVGNGRTVADNPKQEGPKKGQVREVMAGNQTLQYEWDGQQWKKIGGGPRFKDDAPEKPHIYDGPNGPVWVTPPKAGASPTQAVLGPDGQPIQAKKRDQPLTEAQGNATAYAMRAEASDTTLKDLEAKGHNPAAFPGLGNRMAGGQLNVLAPEKAQQYNAAKQNFVTAVLRKESGAAISQSEFDKEDQKYFPQPGDGPAVRAQKTQARQLAIEALKVQAGPAGQSQMEKHRGASGGWSIKPL